MNNEVTETISWFSGWDWRVFIPGRIYGVHVVSYPRRRVVCVFRAGHSFAGPTALADVRVYRSLTLAVGVTWRSVAGVTSRGGLSIGDVLGYDIETRRWIVSVLHSVPPTSITVISDCLVVRVLGSDYDGRGGVAVDASNHHSRWEFTLDDDFAGGSPMVLAGESLYVCENDHRYALEER